MCRTLVGTDPNLRRNKSKDYDVKGVALIWIDINLTGSVKAGVTTTDVSLICFTYFT